MNHYLPRSPERIRDENEQKKNIYPSSVYLNKFPGYSRIILDRRTNIYFSADLIRRFARRRIRLLA
jgi:hypothetical protein